MNMILAIDVGNSNIVLGCIEENTILFEARMASDRLKTSDQYCVELKNMLALFEIDIAKLEGVIVSSVVPPILNSIKTAIRKLTEKPCYVVGPGLKTGLNIRIDNPAQAGSDLVVAAVAAIHEYGAPLTIIDLGTATTITVIDKNKNFIGGSISPGMKISMEALTSRAAQLPGVSVEAPHRAIGRNTVESMQSGIMFGTAAMLDGLIERMEQELGCQTTVVATGGLAPFVVPLCKREIAIDKDLLLKGLNLIYRMNTER